MLLVGDRPTPSPVLSLSQYLYIYGVQSGIRQPALEMFSCVCCFVQVYSVVRGCMRVRLVHCDAGLSAVSINSQLVMEKFAMAAEESYQSKVWFHFCTCCYW